MKRIGVGLALAGWAASVNAASTSSGSWQRAEPFKLSPTKDRCLARSTFTRDGKDLVVTIESRPTSDRYAIKVFAPGKLRVRTEIGNFALGAVKLENPSVIAQRSSLPGTIWYRLDANRAELEAAGPNPELTMKRVTSPGEITLMGLGDSLPFVDACNEMLMERWGYPKVLQRSIAKPPEAKKPLGSYFSTSDYPQSAVAALAFGESHVLIDVGIDGRGTNCRIIRSSGQPDLDQTTCKVLTERVRFAPAVNAHGQAIAAPMYQVVNWDFPNW